MNYVQANADRIERLKKEQLRLARKKGLFRHCVSCGCLMVIHAPKLADGIVWHSIADDAVVPMLRISDDKETQRLYPDESPSFYDPNETIVSIRHRSQ